ncbi:hypothetical protein GGH19_000840 [Coemansia sp. RSA 1807]|nr:hypothetical protein GGF48_000601 [Coemansia sp. RSA 921]KAJ2281949.1 hypothetical protein EV176_000124 [Coemansia sp. RSA 451]KAJ2533695.1 hypothetical protein GGH20_000487 [Coemansia sp. RSA 1937]KAJ2577989.1 hypothetical protein GGH19_000840 [Coemansia sp. RSA 1807]
MDGYTSKIYAAAAGAALYFGASKYVEDSKVRLLVGPSDEHKEMHKLLNQCPSLSENSRLVPTPYLCSGMLQTVYGTQIALRKDRASNIKYVRESKVMSDGGTVSLDWYPEQPSDDVTSIAIVVPGLGGSAYEYHIRCVVRRMYESIKDMRIVVCNHRGSGRTPLTSPRLYNAYDTSDLTDVLNELSTKFPHARLVCIGFSLGANLITRYLGDHGHSARLSAAVAVSCPYDTEVAGRALSAPGLLNDWLFQPNLMATVKRLLRRNIDVIKSSPLNYDIDAIMKASRMSEIDDLVTARTYGHKDCWAYYRAASSVEYVEKIRKPFLAINAEDDPVTPISGVPKDKLANNPCTALALVKHGGHIGFFTGVMSPKIWYLDPVAEFVSAVLE